MDQVDFLKNLTRISVLNRAPNKNALLICGLRIS
jgi:hypothetical protein